MGEGFLGAEMIQVRPQMRILLAVQAVDFRKGIDGLAGICRHILGKAPFLGSVFIFRNRRGTAIRALVYDGQGFWLCHYLGYCQPVGEQLKYLVFAKDRPLACLAWSSAPRHLGDRDRFIGWTKTFREKNLSLIVCNTRFLILPWVQVSCLASHILGKMVKILPVDWERIYHHPLHYLETFVDQERFQGTCYRAANWGCIGQTTGRGKNAQTKRPNRSIKGIWGYPLSKDFRCHLGGGRP